MNRKSYFAKITTDKIISSIALFCVGLCLIVWAEQVTDLIVVALGALSLLYSFVGILRFVKASPKERTNFSLFLIVLSFVLGLLLIAKTDFVKSAITIIIGFCIILYSVISIANLAAIKKAANLSFVAFIWPVVTLILGFLCISGQFIIPDQLARLTGIILVVCAIVYFAGIVSISNQIKTIEKATGIKEAEVVSKKPRKSTTSKTKKTTKTTKTTKASKKSKK
ncbi:DUF308 domain-containing protein [Candidatus Saccharibacteria bacterium]|nr:DUF308 domain-containing protein [Candidatus Saccharibacteria bacterium]